MKLKVFSIALALIATTANAPTTNPPIEFVSEPVVQPIPEPTPEPTPPPSHTHTADRQLDCLARVIHHEARGEGTRGQLAVAYVVVNRKNDNRFPSTICGVATQPKQFSNFSLRRSIPNYNHYFSLARQVTSSYSRNNDPSNGALYFHASHASPKWSRTKRRTATINRHVFYR